MEGLKTFQRERNLVEYWNSQQRRTVELWEAKLLNASTELNQALRPVAWNNDLDSRDIDKLVKTLEAALSDLRMAEIALRTKKGDAG